MKDNLDNLDRYAIQSKLICFEINPYPANTESDKHLPPV